MKFIFVVLALCLGVAGSVRAEELPDEGQINCDNSQYWFRLAFDVEKRRVWGVRLNENGQPETQLPYELRISPLHFVSAEQKDCRNCYYDIRFKYFESSESEMLAEIFTVERDGLAINLYDLVIPEKPEQTWSQISCWKK